ncbi:hypothetical protein [Tenacibaculum agarivorans]|uniref:hypothetical protein n=1 Tax=Tenacibaculum agarivorans TaxID=1908389 RepID=UPI001F459716|nr:hypothetical protein [Tenacibaculum agarivorans]
MIDGIGATVSAFLLGILLVRFEKLFGIPTSSLYFLAVIPLFFIVYDFYCYHKSHHKTGALLKGIAILNLMYCGVSLGFAVYHFDTITILGWIYIVIEIIIVFFLALIEFTVGEELI